jgi:hypothetical protein
LKYLFSLISLLGVFCLTAQTARIKGVILDENNQPVDQVAVTYEKDKGTTTDASGFYLLEVPANQKLTVLFLHVTLKRVELKIQLKPNEEYVYNFKMLTDKQQIGEVIITASNRKRVEGMQAIDPATIRKIPGANAGVENIMKTFGGVNSNNELSTQYAVRGGNYDENLVYVNDIEVYRPFLIRSGQQEGLSFVNSDLVSNVDFSAGGFQAKYGDRLSSVLDITYRKPTRFGASFEGSFLGGAASVDLVSKDDKWTAVTGIRYRDNSLLVNSQETQTNFRPRFADVQTFITYTPNTKWQHSFLGNLSQNKYDYQPVFRQTNFGTIDEPIALQIFYQGQEKDQYITRFAAIKNQFFLNQNNDFQFTNSIYHTTEQEYFDIAAFYRLGEVDTNIGSETFGGVVFTRGVGSQLNHARNDLDGLIINSEIRGNHKIKEHQLQWAFKYTREDLRDRLVEWEVIDSAGFSLNPPSINLPVNDQPYQPYTGPLVPYQNIRSTNFVQINRYSGFAQWSYRTTETRNQWWFNAGVRMHAWEVSGRNIASNSQVVFSPRAQVAFKPEDKDLLFRLAVGVYHQPPMYREMRDFDGVVQSNVKAQQSIHYILSNEYGFQWNNRPFKLISEVYYKDLSDVNTYTLDNVRIRYRANNEAEAYVYGLDMRLHGEFVPGTESWFTFGYMKTQENQNNRGFIDRPTDQRLKFAVLFQDYVPKFPSLKLYLNLVYNTGLPGGSPAYADPYDYQLRLRDYSRADIGFFYVLTDRNELRADNHWLKKWKDLSVGFEIFNMFNNQNAITNTWVRDVYTKNQYGVPNFMTTRVFNLKVTGRW